MLIRLFDVYQKSPVANKTVNLYTGVYVCFLMVRFWGHAPVLIGWSAAFLVGGGAFEFLNEIKNSQIMRVEPIIT